MKTAGFIISYQGDLSAMIDKCRGNTKRQSEFFLFDKYSKHYDKIFIFSNDKEDFSKYLPKNAVQIKMRNKLFYILFGWIVIAYYSSKYNIEHLRVVGSPALPNIFMVNWIVKTRVLLDYNYFWHIPYIEDRRNNSIYEILKKNKVTASFVSFLEKIIVNNFVDYFIVGDPAVKKFIKDKDKILSLKKGIILEEFDFENAKPYKIYKKIKGPSVVFTARLVPMKDPLTLIKAYKIAKKTVPDLNLIICGDGELLEECKKNSDQNVHLLGMIDDIAGVLKKADIFVCPSKYDPSPRSLIEAMAMGLPCIATNTGGIPYYLDESCGILVETQNPKEMAEKIIYLLNNPKTAKQLGTKAKEKIYKEHDLN
ncbi:MAG: glycosyltransferase family 4 protein, partial [Candidatus Aenigmarchaeota archaeon]|nr:glycosyltransferase family 4 protein [Candidatus Aenigmarchaeota archaeon]